MGSQQRGESRTGRLGRKLHRGGDLLRRVGAAVIAENLIDVAAGAAFWGVLALFPFLLFVIAVSSHAMGRQNIEALVGLITPLAPEPVKNEVQGFVLGAFAGMRRRDAILALVVALWSATGGAVSLGDALNRAQGVMRDPRTFTVRRVQALGATLLAALCLLVATVVMTLLPRVLDRVFAGALLGPLASVAWTLVRWGSSLFLASLAWALAYRLLPCVHGPFRLVTPGSLVGIPLWLVASLGFSFYVAHFADYGAAYGALGGAVIFLLWVWLSTFILLVGGEINALVEADARGQSDAGPGSR